MGLSHIFSDPHLKSESLKLDQLLKPNLIEFNCYIRRKNTRNKLNIVTRKREVVRDRRNKVQVLSFLKRVAVGENVDKESYVAC